MRPASRSGGVEKHRLNQRRTLVRVGTAGWGDEGKSMREQLTVGETEMGGVFGMGLGLGLGAGDEQKSGGAVWSKYRTKAVTKLKRA